MEPIPGIRTMDALGRRVLRQRPQAHLGLTERERRCL